MKEAKIHACIFRKPDMCPDAGIEVDAVFPLFHQPEILGKGGITEGDGKFSQPAGYLPAQKGGSGFLPEGHEAFFKSSAVMWESFFSETVSVPSFGQRVFSRLAWVKALT